MTRDLDTLQREFEEQTARLEEALGELATLAESDGERVIGVADDVLSELEALTTVSPRRAPLPHPFAVRG